MFARSDERETKRERGDQNDSWTDAVRLIMSERV